MPGVISITRKQICGFLNMWLAECMHSEISFWTSDVFFTFPVAWKTMIICCSLVLNQHPYAERTV